MSKNHTPMNNNSIIREHGNYKRSTRTADQKVDHLAAAMADLAAALRNTKRSSNCDGRQA